MTLALEPKDTTATLRRKTAEMEINYDSLPLHTEDSSASTDPVAPIHSLYLGDTDPFDAILGGPDEIEMLLSDPTVQAAIDLLLQPSLPDEIAHLHALQSEAITPEERALPRFTRRTLQTLPTWPAWHDAETQQLDQFQLLGMFGTPQKPPRGAIILRPHWQHRVKAGGKRRSRFCCDGSPRAAPRLHQPGIDNSSTCIEQPMLRLFFALAAAENLVVIGGDARDAFAHSPGPSTPTFVRVDDAFIEWYRRHTGITLDRSLVIPILRALQGHPEAGRLWDIYIGGILKDVGFHNTTHEKSIYQGTIRGKRVLLARQVDDFALACKKASEADYIYGLIGERLKVSTEKDVPFVNQGLLSEYNGHDVLQTRDYIKLSATSYIRRLLKGHHWEKPSKQEASTNSKPRPPIHKDDIAEMYYTPRGPPEGTPEHAAIAESHGFSYRSLLGEILYAYVLNRVDIGYAVTTLAKFSIGPQPIHYQALKHLAIYLRHTIEWGIIYWRPAPNDDLPNIPYECVPIDPDLPPVPIASSHLQLVSYVDAAHGNELLQRRSTTGYGCCLSGGAVAYRSHTQPITAQNSTEAELVGTNSCGKVSKYLRCVLAELLYRQTAATPIYVDNKSTIQILQHDRPTERSRHIEIRYFGLQQWQALGHVAIHHIAGIINPADVLTKALGWLLHSRHARFLMGHYGFRPSGTGG